MDLVRHHRGLQLPQTGPLVPRGGSSKLFVRVKHGWKLQHKRAWAGGQEQLCAEQDAVKTEQQLMSPTVVLQWFPTLGPDVHVQLVLRIGKLIPPGKTMRIVVELDTRRRSLTS